MVCAWQVVFELLQGGTASSLHFFQCERSTLSIILFIIKKKYIFLNISPQKVVLLLYSLFSIESSKNKRIKRQKRRYKNHSISKVQYIPKVDLDQSFQEKKQYFFGLFSLIIFKPICVYIKIFFLHSS